MEHGFLKEKYGLHKSQEVERAAERTEQRTGEKVPQDPEARIQNYLDRLQNIINPPKLEGHSGFDRRERNLEMIKRGLYNKFVIKPEDIPEQYFDNQRRLAREQGHGDIEITRETRDQFSEVIVTDQRNSLNNWVDYLASPDAAYPDWLKYWTIRSMLGIGEYDKEKKAFAKRSKGTTKPFPDINREALAYVLDAVSQKYGKRHMELLALDEGEKKEFEKLLQGENFAKLYAWALEKTAIAPTESLAKTAGKWVKYSRDSNRLPLVESLRGHGTGWCTAGESTAQIQLKGGDFYVYYSFDQKGGSTIPRAAIRMEEDRIAEVRGIGEQQNLDSYIAPVVESKLKEFSDGAAFEKKTEDMKMLTTVERKSKINETLTKDDLVFLYEINAPIEGFGYQRDPRIAELRSQRNSEEDMAVVFECGKEQIAYNIFEIKEGTMAYVGPLVPGIFDKIQKYGIEQIYTSFPAGRIRKETIEIGGKNAATLIKEMRDKIKEMRDKKINISDYAMDILKSREFTTQKEIEDAILIRLKVGDLGFPKNKYPITDEIYRRIEELGLELCPAEIGPHYRLKYLDQLLGEWFRIGMKQITDRVGSPRVLSLARSEDGLWLDDLWTYPGDEWAPSRGFVFRLRKLKNLET
ncbi:MAG: hypothetical protein Q7R91_02720 [bacterium]|nr:hypothetical protein [bacterium]